MLVKIVVINGLTIRKATTKANTIKTKDTYFGPLFSFIIVMGLARFELATSAYSIQRGLLFNCRGDVIAARLQAPIKNVTVNPFKNVAKVSYSTA